jgi:hypothetical protein
VPDLNETLKDRTSARRRNPEERRRNTKRYRERHKVELALKARAYQKRRPDVYRRAAIRHYWKHRDRLFAKRYGLTIEEFLSLPKQCEICSSATNLCIDHCHVSKEVRGVLCDWCDVGLGRFKDNPVFLASAASYLMKRDDAYAKLAADRVKGPPRNTAARSTSATGMAPRVGNA